MPLAGLDHAVMEAVQALWSQGAHIFFAAASFLGEAGFLVALVVACWWCLDRDLGEYLIFALYTSIALNGALKDLFRRPRPFLNPDFSHHKYLAMEGPVDTVHLAQSWSFPSGHSQCAATGASALCFWFRRRWAAFLALGVTLWVMASRVYLGVHYPTDTLAGALLGLLVSWAVWRLMGLLGEKRLWIMGGAAGLALLSLLWSPSPDTVKTAGLGVGALAGLLLERHFVGFKTQGPWGRRLLRFLLGLAFLAGVQFGLKALLPEGGVFLWLRYACLGFAAAGIWPAVFVKLGL